MTSQWSQSSSRSAAKCRLTLRSTYQTIRMTSWGGWRRPPFPWPCRSQSWAFFNTLLENWISSFERLLWLENTFLLSNMNAVIDFCECYIGRFLLQFVWNHLESIDKLMNGCECWLESCWISGLSWWCRKNFINLITKNILVHLWKLTENCESHNENRIFFQQSWQTATTQMINVFCCFPYLPFVLRCVFDSNPLSQSTEWWNLLGSQLDYNRSGIFAYKSVQSDFDTSQLRALASHDVNQRKKFPFDVNLLACRRIFILVDSML